MRTKFYLLLIALVTTIGSVWGQNTEGYAFNIAGVSGTSSLLRYSILTPAVGSEKGTVEVVRENSYLTATDPFIIPATVTNNSFDYDVVAVGAGAFYFDQVNQLTAEIVIGPNVIELKYRSIRQTGLTRIHIPANVKSIAEEALYGNVYLSEVTIGHGSDFVLVDNVLYSSGGKTLLVYPLADPLLATSYTVPVELESLGALNLPSTIERIRVESGNSFFSSRDGVLFSADGKTLIKYPAGKDDITIYEVPPSVETIASRAFQFTQIEGINFSNVTHLGYAALSHSSLAGTVIIPETVTVIDAYQFNGCSNLVEVIFKGSVEFINTVGTNVGEGMFSYTPLLERVDFGPTTFDMVPNRMFEGCVALEEIILPADVSHIGTNAFRDCESLTTITILGETPLTVASSAFSASATGTAPDLASITLHVPKGSFDDYNTTSPWSGFGTILDDFYLVVYKNEGETYLTETYPASADYTLTKPTSPTRVGYTFEGWYDASGKVVPFDATKYGIHNTITARWAAIPLPVIPTYTITIEPLAGVTVNKEGGTVNEGRPFSFTAEAAARGNRVIVYVNGKEHASTSDNFYLIEGIEENITITFSLTAGAYAEDSVVGGITINGEPLNDKKTDFPEEGKIVITFNDDADRSVPGKVIIDGKEVPGTWGTDSNGNPTYTIDYAVIGDGKHTIKIEGFGGDGETHTFTTGGGNGNNGTSTDGKVVIDGSESTIPGEFPSTGEIVLYPPAVTPGNTPSVTIDGETVTGEWTKDEDGKYIYVVGYDDLEDGEHTIVVDGDEYTFTTEGGEGGSDSGSTGGTKVIIDGSSPVIPGEFPSTGGVVIYPPAVDPSNPGKVTIDGKEVTVTVITDANGKPIAIEIEYEGLADGKHTLVINGKEYTFTTSKNAGATSNDVLSTATITASYGTITIDTPKQSTVYVVSLSGSVVYNAKVVGTVTVNVPAGIYIVAIDGKTTKVVVR